MHAPRVSLVRRGDIGSGRHWGCEVRPPDTKWLHHADAGDCDVRHSLIADDTLGIRHEAELPRGLLTDGDVVAGRGGQRRECKALVTRDRDCGFAVEERDATALAEPGNRAPERESLSARMRHRGPSSRRARPENARWSHRRLLSVAKR